MQTQDQKDRQQDRHDSRAKHKLHGRQGPRLQRVKPLHRRGLLMAQFYTCDLQGRKSRPQKGRTSSQVFHRSADTSLGQVETQGPRAPAPSPLKPIILQWPPCAVCNPGRCAQFFRRICHQCDQANRFSTPYRHGAWTRRSRMFGTTSNMDLLVSLIFLPRKLSMFLNVLLQSPFQRSFARRVQTHVLKRLDRFFQGLDTPPLLVTRGIHAKPRRSESCTQSIMQPKPIRRIVNHTLSKQHVNECVLSHDLTREIVQRDGLRDLVVFASLMGVFFHFRLRWACSASPSTTDAMLWSRLCHL